MPFPESIRRLPRTKLAGLDAFVHDRSDSQVVFLEAPSDRPEVVVPTHTHDVEWGVVIEGEIEMTLDGRVEIHRAGSTHLIASGVPHSFRFRPGTSSVHYFVERRVAVGPPAQP
jgi:mannose-6-phosphate isomerase-like protein (cupin superfamily)